MADLGPSPLSFHDNKNEENNMNNISEVGQSPKVQPTFYSPGFNPENRIKKKLVNRLRGVCRVGTPLHHFKNSLLSIKIAKKKRVNPWTYLWPDRQN